MSDRRQSNTVFNDLRLEIVFCDAVIRVEEVTFPIHRVVLCGCSPYFLALFKRWSPADKKVFDIPGLSPDMMRLIIEFAYTGSVDVTEANVQELMLAADQLNVIDIVQTCCDFLEEQLCPENCIGIFQFTNICCSIELRRKAYRFIVDHFEKVVISEEFLQLSVQELAGIVERDDLNVRKESVVFEAILRWIAHAPKERSRHIVVLLYKVRLGLTSLDYMRINVLSNELIRNNPVCEAVANEAIGILHRIRTNGSSLSVACNLLARPRLPNAILLAIGGWSGSNPTNEIEVYNVRANCWTDVTYNHLSPRAYHGTAFLDGSVYCVGGFDRLEHFNSVLRFNLSTCTRHEVAPMHHRRCYVSIAVLNGCIYAMGGYNGIDRLCTAERYRPETNQWSLIPPMHEHRSDASCTTLHSKVYICGGFDGNNCLQTAECYSPETNQWTMISPMTCQRSGIGVITYADQVYAVGGFNGIARQRSAEAYDPRTNTWHLVSPMMTPRSNFGIEVLDDHLFVVGGFNGISTTCDVEYYDATSDGWSAACEMEISRSALSCCVVSGLPNMAEYTVPRDSLPILHLEDESLDSLD